MRTSTIYAAFAALVMTGAVAIPVPAPAAVATPAQIEAREPQLLSSLLGMIFCCHGGAEEMLTCA